MPVGLAFGSVVLVIVIFIDTSSFLIGNSALDIFDNNKPTDASGNEVTDVTRYVVFLTDGIPEAPYNYTVDSRCNRYRNPIPEECKTALKEKSQLLKDQGVVVIVIGYGISNPVFSEMASSNTKNASGYDLCPILTDSSGNKYGENTCYYTSGKTSGLSDIFKAITKTIKYSVANKTITKAEIVGTFSNDIIMKDLDGNVVTSINRTIEVEDNRVSSDQTISEVAEYKLSLKNVNFPCDYDRRECSKTIPILDSYKLVLYNGDEVVKSVDLDSSYIPKVTITKELKDYIN